MKRRRREAGENTWANRENLKQRRRKMEEHRVKEDVK
jgi:hypothetical protein